MNIEKAVSLHKLANAPFASLHQGNDVSMPDLTEAARNKAALCKEPEFRNCVMNANTIPTGLKRDAALQEVVTDFARKLISLNLFSTVYRNVPLQGTDKVQVPYYELDAGASTSFKSSDGYVAGNTATSVRAIQVGKRADADVLDDTKTYDRKYQAIAFSSQEIARQPFLKTVELATQKMNKLASDILAHIFSIVTVANFGAAAKTEMAETFDSDDVVDLKLACKLWPEDGRVLLLNSDYDAALLKDPAFKAAYAAGTDRAIKEGKLFPRVNGFDYLESPTIPENGENLVGMAAFKSAILAAFAPVPPIEEVRNAGTQWSMFIDPPSGVVLEYRSFGDAQMDTGTHVIESSYGFEKGNGDALKRICRP